MCDDDDNNNNDDDNNAFSCAGGLFKSPVLNIQFVDNMVCVNVPLWRVLSRLKNVLCYPVKTMILFNSRVVSNRFCKEKLSVLFSQDC